MDKTLENKSKLRAKYWPHLYIWPKYAVRPPVLENLLANEKDLLANAGQKVNSMKGHDTRDHEQCLMKGPGLKWPTGAMKGISDDMV
jgi:hypothetical protein